MPHPVGVMTGGEPAAEGGGPRICQGTSGYLGLISCAVEQQLPGLVCGAAGGVTVGQYCLWSLTLLRGGCVVTDLSVCEL